MEPSFWQQSWREEGSKTSFHRKDIHPYVQKYATPDQLAGKRVLVPLCGKTNDLTWFRRYADHVTGIELVEKPILQFFSEHQLPYIRSVPGRFEAERLTILNANIFEIEHDDIGHVDLVYDRAALVAFPLHMRLNYLQKIHSLLPVGAQIFLNTLEYAPLLPSPPFSISPSEVEQYYGSAYTITHLEQPEIPDHGMVRKFGLNFLKEHAFLLTKEKNTPLTLEATLSQTSS